MVDESWDALIKRGLVEKRISNSLSCMKTQGGSWPPLASSADDHDCLVKYLAYTLRYTTNFKIVLALFKK